MSRMQLTMSRMALSHACSWGFGPNVDVTPRPVGRSARLGTVVHAMADAFVRGLPWEAPDEEPTILAEAAATFEGSLRGYLARTEWTGSEIGLRYHAEDDKAEPGPRRGEPGYEDVGPMVLPGTLDLVRVEAGRLVIRDIKTGKPPTDREQLYAQAVAGSRTYGRNVVEIGYLRALKTRTDELDVETLDADALDYHAGRIRRTLRLLPTSEPNPGEHCWKCDARPVCPAQQPDDSYREPEAPAELTEDARLF